MIVALEEMKNYLRVDSSDDDALILSLISSTEKLCVHVSRLEEHEVEAHSAELKIAILYAVAYLYEHREDANHNELTLTLRALLFGVRKEGF